MVKYYKFYFLIVIAYFFLSSCNSDVLFSDEIKIDKGLWGIKESINFQIPADDIGKNYNIFIMLDVFEDFLTSNIWLFVSSKSPSGNIQTDSMMFYVFDDRGKWYGNKKGTIIQNKFLYKGNIRFPEKGNYLINIQHGMREKDLPKVRTLGIQVESFKSPEK